MKHHFQQMWVIKEVLGPPKGGYQETVFNVENRMALGEKDLFHWISKNACVAGQFK